MTEAAQTTEPQPATGETPPEIPIQIEYVHMLFDKVLIRMYGTTEKSAGGIVLPITAQERKNFAWVVRIGPLAQEKLPDLKIGDTITFAPHMPTTHPTFQIPPTPQGVKYYEITATDISAILRKPQ